MLCFRLCFWLLLFIFVAEKANKSDTNVKKLPMNLKRLLPLLIVPLLLTACPSGANRTKNGPDLRNLPREIRSGEQGPFHVQGIAVDLERGYIYFSFTTKLLKMDFEGNLIGSVDGMTGHLGCLTMNPADGRVYGSLEYKDDAIGKGIRRTLDAGQVAPEDEKDRTGFYVAIFDVDRITRPDMDAEKDRVMTTVYIKEAVDDYFATAENGGLTVEHRFGCSGIDGVTFAPRFGAKEGGDYLYVAYGVYGDTLRTDNDYQVLLAYDTKDWKRFEQPLSQGSLHKSGPAAPDHKYFVRTGNTNVDFFFTTISQEDIGIIKHAMQSHIDIFQYKEIELPVVLDGVINTFEFMLDENFTNTITAYNIGAFRKDVNIGIIGTHPYKGSTILQLFDKISKILLEHGVDPKYVRIS